jgi:transposase InsO family protein
LLIQTLKDVSFYQLRDLHEMTRRKKSVSSLLKSHYFDCKQPGSFSARQSLHRELNRRFKRKVSCHQVQQWLSSQDVHTLHRDKRRHFPRAPIVVRSIDDQWELDLVEMQPFAKYNNGMRYILCCIDVLSKMAWAVPVQRKTGELVTSAFAEILRQAHPRIPRCVRTDRGKEFCNIHFRSMCVKHHIHTFTTSSDQKCAVIERWNRTIKSRMWRYFRHKSTLTWTDALPQLVSSYNHSFHRSIQNRPVNVNKENEMEVWHRLYNGRLPETRNHVPSPKFEAGTQVRISLHNPSNPFIKGYARGWSEEVFEIKSHHPKHFPHMYTLMDAKGEELEGKFYEHELQRVAASAKLWVIDKVISIKKMRDGTFRYLVRWQDSSAKPSWIHQKDMRKL